MQKVKLMFQETEVLLHSRTKSQKCTLFTQHMSHPKNIHGPNKVWGKTICTISKKALVANCVLEHRKGYETLDPRAKAQRNVSRS